MLKKTITYVDYNGVERTEDFYFNLSKAELLDMEMLTPGGYSNVLERIIAEKDQIEIVKQFKELVRKSYGVKSDDGRRFMKSDDLTRAFMETEAYSQLYMELATDSDAGASFCNGILPSDLSKQINDKDVLIDKFKALEDNRK